jgi:hypothetical protein
MLISILNKYFNNKLWHLSFNQAITGALPLNFYLHAYASSAVYSLNRGIGCLKPFECSVKQLNIFNKPASFTICPRT